MNSEMLQFNDGSNLNLTQNIEPDFTQPPEEISHILVDGCTADMIELRKK